MKRIIIILICLSLVACAGHRPLVDLKGSAPDKNNYTYEADLKECQQYAEPISVAGSSVAGAIIGGAIVGALGIAVYSVLGLDPAEGLAVGATIGGFQGALEGGVGSGQSQVMIINNCMSGRGYSVLH